MRTDFNHQWLIKNILYVLVSIVALPVAAEEPPVPYNQFSSGGMVAEVVLALLCVLASILALGWLVKKMGMSGFSQQQGMKVLSTLAISTREKIVWVDVGGTQLLLGVAPGSVSCLHVIREGKEDCSQENLSDATENPKDKNPMPMDEKWEFSHYLKKIIANDGMQK